MSLDGVVLSARILMLAIVSLEHDHIAESLSEHPLRNSAATADGHDPAMSFSGRPIKYTRRLPIQTAEVAATSGRKGDEPAVVRPDGPPVVAPESQSRERRAIAIHTDLPGGDSATAVCHGRQGDCAMNSAHDSPRRFAMAMGHACRRLIRRGVSMSCYCFS